VNTRYYTNSSAYTGRSCRTLSEAFGPHTTSHISEREPMHPHDRIVTVASAIVAVIAVALVAYGVIS
jgi:hypothetical protein